MPLESQQFDGFDVAHTLGMPVRHAILKAGGAAGLQVGYLDLLTAYHRIGLVGAFVQGVTTAAGGAVLEMRKAPLAIPAGSSWKNPTYGDDWRLTPGTEWDRICDHIEGAAASRYPQNLLPPGTMLVSRPQHDGAAVPLLRWRDRDSVVAAQTGTFSGVPTAGETVTVFGVAGTWRAALTVPAVANEILLGADAATCAENLRRWINGGLGRGESYSTSTVPKDKTTGGYAVADAHATVVTVRAYAGGTAGNALTVTDTSTNFAWGAGVLAGGADGNLGSATTDFLEVALYYVVFRDKAAAA